MLLVLNRHKICICRW